jgi:hypothetical protein
MGGPIKYVRKHTKLMLGILVAFTIGGASTTAVLAAIPDNNNIIHGCYSSGILGTGALRIIDSPSQSCNITETALGWSKGPLAMAHVK